MFLTLPEWYALRVGRGVNMVEAGDEAVMRREALSAFSHEIRTPLTSIRMILDLALKDAATGGIILDAELATMLDTSLHDLQTLADDLQDDSRLERGRLPLDAGPTSLRDALRQALEGTKGLNVALPPFETVSGPWDTAQLIRALADLAAAADRGGAGTGNVSCIVSVAGPVAITFSSGEPGGDPKPIGPDLGFRFFRARAVIRAMRGEVAVDRGARCARITIRLPSN